MRALVGVPNYSFYRNKTYLKLVVRLLISEFSEKHNFLASFTKYFIDVFTKFCR